MRTKIRNQSSKNWGGRRPGSGAPGGNKNALKHGSYDKKMKTEKKNFNEIIRAYQETIQYAKNNFDWLIIGFMTISGSGLT